MVTLSIGAVIGICVGCFVVGTIAGAFVIALLAANGKDD